MCLSCGCGKPNDSHGDSRNITKADLRAAQKAGPRRSLKHTANTIKHTLRKKGR